MFTSWAEVCLDGNNIMLLWDFDCINIYFVLILIWYWYCYGGTDHKTLLMHSHIIIGSSGMHALFAAEQ